MQQQGWPPPWAPPPHSFELAMLLGRVEAESRRQTEIMLGINERLIDLPDRLAARLASAPASASAQATTPATSAHAQPAVSTTASGYGPASPPSLVQRLGTIRDWVMALSMLTALALVLTGKMSGPEFLEFVKAAIGLK